VIAREALGRVPDLNSATTNSSHKNVMQCSEKLLGTICCVKISTRSADFPSPLTSRANLFCPCCWHKYLKFA
jgi:hypothetical protein